MKKKVFAICAVIAAILCALLLPFPNLEPRMDLVKSDILLENPRAKIVDIYPGDGWSGYSEIYADYIVDGESTVSKSLYVVERFSDNWRITKKYHYGHISAKEKRPDQSENPAVLHFKGEPSITLRFDGSKASSTFYLARPVE